MNEEEEVAAGWGNGHFMCQILQTKNTDDTSWLDRNVVYKG
jgi:hypothetical protein